MREERSGRNNPARIRLRKAVMDANSNRPTCRNCDEARQGVTGHHVRKVLGWGVIGTILAFAAIAITA